MIIIITMCALLRNLGVLFYCEAQQSECSRYTATSKPSLSVPPQPAKSLSLSLTSLALALSKVQRCCHVRLGVRVQNMET